MRTFAFACAVAVVVAKKKHHTVEPPRQDEKPKEEVVKPEPEHIEPEHKANAHLDFYGKLELFDFYAKNIWDGCYLGLYGMGKLDQRPSEECFGEWIPEKL